MSQLLLSTRKPGWVARQEQRSTLVKLIDGSTVWVNRQPSLVFGTPVTVELMNSHHCRGSVLGEIIEAWPLPAIPIIADRPLAVLDASNIAGVADVETGKPYGLLAVWASSWILHSAGYAVRLVDDPESDRFWHRDPISSAVLLRLQSAPFSRLWPRIVKDWGMISHNADVTALSLLRENPKAIFVTLDSLDDCELHDRFPMLDDFDFIGRIFAPRIENGRIAICGLDDIPPAVIPTILFS